METTETKKTVHLSEEEKKFLREHGEFCRKEIKEVCRHLGFLLAMSENNPMLFTEDWSGPSRDAYELFLDQLSDGEKDEVIEQILEQSPEQTEEKTDDEDRLNEKRWAKTINDLVTHCWQILSGWQQPIVRSVIKRLVEQLPEKIMEWDDDDARQEAVDELLNEVVCDMSTEQIVACTKEAKNNGALKLAV